MPRRYFIILFLCRSDTDTRFRTSNLHDLGKKKKRKKEKKEESTHRWVANINGTVLSANSSPPDASTPPIFREERGGGCAVVAFDASL